MVSEVCGVFSITVGTEGIVYTFSILKSGILHLRDPWLCLRQGSALPSCEAGVVEALCVCVCVLLLQMTAVN